jgi:lysophospholipase L1-like esterase
MVRVPVQLVFRRSEQQRPISSFRVWMWALAVVQVILLCTAARPRDNETQHWIGTWAAAPQRPAGNVETFRNQTLRLIVHTSAGGNQVRVRISNLFGDAPLVIGSAHIARRSAEADIDPQTDKALSFGGKPSTGVNPGSTTISDPVTFDVPPLSDLAISLFFPHETRATTLHVLAKQTNYIAGNLGDTAAEPRFTVGKTISSWPFLTGVDVAASPKAGTIVAFGSSLTDGDGSTRDSNHRWPDILAERLQKNGDLEFGVVNEGVIGNRLLKDSSSPRQSGGPPPLGPILAKLGPALGEAGLARFDRDVLEQPGVKYVIIALGINDILFPGSFIADTERVTADDLISAYRQLVVRAHKKNVRAIGSTMPPVEHATFKDPFFDGFYTAEKEQVRRNVNTWIRNSHEFDGVIDFDLAVRDPQHPTQLLPAYDSGDHLHVNDAGNIAQADVIPLSLFRSR